MRGHTQRAHLYRTMPQFSGAFVGKSGGQESSLCATSCGRVVAERSKTLKHHDRQARLAGKVTFAQRLTAEYL